MDADDAYANAAYIPDAASYPPRWVAQAAAFRDGVQAELNRPYGKTDRETFDLFLPKGPPRGTVVFVHGGYWRAFDKSVWSHLAAGPMAHGWAVAMPGYDLCPTVRIAQITVQIARAVSVIADRMPGPLVLTGHSAGGHLVARMACADFPPSDLAQSVRDRIARIVPISPLSDLAPLMDTAMNTDLRIDAAEAVAESPLRHPRADLPVTVWVGGAERPAFLDQARWLADAWNCGLVVDAGRHHFDVIEPLADPESPLVAALIGQSQ
jgi:arylformamidase